MSRELQPGSLPTGNESSSNSVGSNRPIWILPALVTGQVLATSTWFAGNAVADDIGLLSAHAASVGQITLMVQLGFIVGTLVVATSGISDWV